MWVDPEEDPREAGVEPVDERSTVTEFLRRYRLTLEMKCSGLDAGQLALRSVPPSTMSLLGLIRHMAEVERWWFRRILADEDAPSFYCTETNLDGDWDDAAPDPALVDDAWQTWRTEVEFAERFVASVSDLGMTGRHADAEGATVRWVLVHMVEEYARHCGHADLLRERIDGRVGQ
jgi:uncharacterized damage-inducible protein DinB